MNRSEKVREIYLELYRELGAGVSQAELMIHASQILDLAEADSDGVGSRYGVAVGRTPFDELPLDVLFEKWGWKLVSEDFRSDDDEAVNARLDQTIVHLLAEAA